MIVTPFNQPGLNRNEKLNEMVNYLSSLIMLIFNNIGLDPIARQNLGWIYICWVGLSIFLNVGQSTIVSGFQTVEAIKEWHS